MTAVLQGQKQIKLVIYLTPLLPLSHLFVYLISQIIPFYRFSFSINHLFSGGYPNFTLAKSLEGRYYQGEFPGQPVLADEPEQGLFSP